MAITKPLPADRDERLAVLLNSLVEQLQSGGTPDPEELIHHHPDLARELRELWATAQFAVTMGRAPASPQSNPIEFLTADESPRSPTEFAPPLPRKFGDYELLVELGRGGMGVVYKARQKSLQRMVALKMVRDPQLASPMERARFRGEAEAVARLSHPNIVTVLEVGEHEGQAYFAMEYIEGETLAQRMALGPMRPREAARLLATVARAVEHAHTQGILHRDLKPSNILLAGNIPYVSDFGLAKFLAEHAGDTPDWRTHTGQIVGTPGYMPPEQAAGSRGTVGPACDVYSLGAILYEMLTGRPPFQAANPVDTLLMVLEQEPVPPRLLNAKVDRELETICLKCLQKPSKLRYPGAAELAEDLEAFVAGESLSTSPSGLGYFLARMLRETHHASVLENWGLLWMWHSLMIFLLCLLTQVMEHWLWSNHLAYLLLWSVGLGTWGVILWRLRKRAGPVLFVERQIAHAWAAGVCASIFMFVIEVVAGLPALSLSPAIAVAAGMVFVFKAGILSGQFYLAAGLNFLTAIVMPLVPTVQIVLFGLVSAVCFFVPGLKYYRQRTARERSLPQAG